MRHDLVKQSELSQNACGVWPKHHSSTDLAKFRRAFINGNTDADPMERHGRCDTPDTTPDDPDIFIRPFSHYAKITAASSGLDRH
jgi:hypothetical protein